MFLRQFFDPASSTFTYLIADRTSGNAAIIDAVINNTDLYVQFIEEFNLTLDYVLDTHTHADHITASGHLRKQLGAKIVTGKQSAASPVDRHVQDGDIVNIGSLALKAIYTPGHTDDSYCFACEDALFTGDTLLIRGTGRTDFQSGDARLQYKMITEKLLTLPNDTKVYPGHDYKVATMSTINEEKMFNPRLQVASAEAYAELMNNLHLPKPKQIETAIPANLHCGLMEN